MTNRKENNLTITRIFSSPVEDVYSAWIDPEQIVKWHAPAGGEVLKASVDLKVGGQYNIEMKSDCIKPVVSGKYIEIKKSKRLIYTWQWNGENQPITQVTVEFRPIEDKTEVTLTHHRFVDVDSKDKHESGWNGCLDSLENFIKN